MAWADEYILSKNIKVFPCAYRGQNGTDIFDPEARLNTEFNVVHTGLIKNNNTNSDSYIVSWSETNKKLCFVIHGYYFEITNKNLEWFKDKYLCINIDTTKKIGENTTEILKSFVTSDQSLDTIESSTSTDYYFTGLKLCNSAADGDYSLQVSYSNAGATLLRYDNFLPNIRSGLGHTDTTVNSICIGTDTKANAANTFAAGKGTIANKENLTVVGQYNDEAVEGDLFIVGVGSDSSHKFNAVTVNKTSCTIAKDTNIIADLNIGGGNISAKANGDLKVTGNTSIGTNGDVAISASDKTTTVNGTLIVDNTLNANNDIIINNANKLFIKDQNDETIIEAGEDVGSGGYVLSTVGNIEIFGDLSFAGSGDHYVRFDSGSYAIGNASDGFFIGKQDGAELTLKDGGKVIFDKINTGLYVNDNAGNPGRIFGDLEGNASTATKFNSNRTISLSGDISGSASSNGSNGWSITNIAIGASKVTNAMLAGGISNSKLSNNSIKIGTTSISLGGSASSIYGLTSLTASASNSYISLTGSNSYISLTGSNSYIKTKKIKKDSYTYDLPDKSGTLGLKTFNTINEHDSGWLYSGNRITFGLNKSTNIHDDTPANIGRYKYEGLEYNTNQQMFINYNNFGGTPGGSFTGKPCQFAWSFWGEDYAGSVMQLTHDAYSSDNSVILNVNGKIKWSYGPGDQKRFYKDSYYDDSNNTFLENQLTAADLPAGLYYANFNWGYCRSADPNRADAILKISTSSTWKSNDGNLLHSQQNLPYNGAYAYLTLSGFFRLTETKTVYIYAMRRGNGSSLYDQEGFIQKIF